MAGDLAKANRAAAFGGAGIGAGTPASVLALDARQVSRSQGIREREAFLKREAKAKAIEKFHRDRRKAERQAARAARQPARGFGN